MGPDSPADFFVDVWFDELGTPVTVVAADEAHDADVVQQAGEDDVLAAALEPCMARTLQKMLARAEAQAVKIDELRLVGHLRKPRIVPHQEFFAGVLGLLRRAVDETTGILLSRRI